MYDVLLAFGLTLIAGLSTGVGSLIALLARRTDRRSLSVSLGFSAGVMVYVSMVELLDTARESLTVELGARGGSGLCAADRAFAVGSDDIFGFNGADFPGCDSLRLSQSARKREKDGVQYGDWWPDGDCLPD